MDPTNYNSWTKLGLVERVRQLEAELQRRPAAPEPKPTAPQHGDAETAEAPGSTKPKVKRKMDPSKYSTRFIALKLAYLGKNYGGFEFQAVGNQPTIEEELWNALTKACLIFPEDEKIVDFNICEYSKCGRTDRGVSAFGQVIGIRVRSNKPLPKEAKQTADEVTTGDQAEGQEQEAEEKPFDPIADEIPYPMVLNRLLPPEIRILAWCPSPPPDFSARFSCRERQYRYFFTQPAFAPEPSDDGGGGAKSGWLDIAAMRDAAKRFEGEQDFRNVCKVDPAKLITNWSRTIFESDIVEVQDAATALPYVTGAGFSPAHLEKGGKFPRVYYFHVRGSAFLWHQIRHMVAVLFLVGQGLEKPSIVTELLDVDKYPRKPGYAMADEVPLVLWDCVFPDLARADEAPLSASNRHVDTMQWIYAGAETSSKMRTGQFGPFGALDGMWKVWRGHKMDELLSSRLLQLMAEQGSSDGDGADATKKLSEKPQSNKKSAQSVRLYEGGNTGRPAGKYVPMKNKDKLESPDELNDKYARRKGFVDAADMRARRNEAKDAVMQEGE